jgi:hypothetical protein
LKVAVTALLTYKVLAAAYSAGIIRFNNVSMVVQVELIDLTLFIETVFVIVAVKTFEKR